MTTLTSQSTRLRKFLPPQDSRFASHRQHTTRQAHNRVARPAAQKWTPVCMHQQVLNSGLDITPDCAEVELGAGILPGNQFSKRKAVILVESTLGRMRLI